MNSRSQNSRAALFPSFVGRGTANYYKFNFAYTLAEIVIVMLIIAVVVSVSIKITKTKLDNIVSYTYYSGYSTLGMLQLKLSEIIKRQIIPTLTKVYLG